MTGPNPILDANNAPIKVTNIVQSSTSPGTQSEPWFPLGTGGNSTTGELLLKVSVRETTATAGGTYTSHPMRATVEALDIPIGAKSWSVTAISGTVSVGGVALPVGATIGGGGTGGTLATAITVNAGGGDAIFTYDT